MDHKTQLALARIDMILSGTVDTPRRMDSDTTARDVCNAFDVYFNGIRQLCCKVADVDKGYIVRYRKSVGRRPVGTLTEVLRGKVEIRRKGEVQQDKRADDASVGSACGGSAQTDSGVAGAVPRSTTAPESTPT